MTTSELVARDLATEATRPGQAPGCPTTARTVPAGRWSELTARPGRTISVVLPALDEEETIESVIDSISPLVRDRGGLVDELIVLDSGSTDETEIRAIAAGARVVSREQALPELPTRPGKGEVLWRSLAATSGDVVVFVDSDLINPHPMFVPWLVGPLLTGDGIHLVKSFYRRPLMVREADGVAIPARRRLRQPVAGGSPNWWPGRCWPRCGPSWAASGSRSAASTRPAGNC